MDGSGGKVGCLAAWQSCSMDLWRKKCCWLLSKRSSSINVTFEHVDWQLRAVRVDFEEMKFVLCALPEEIRHQVTYLNKHCLCSYFRRCQSGGTSKFLVNEHFLWRRNWLKRRPRYDHKRGKRAEISICHINAQTYIHTQRALSKWRCVGH